MAMADLGVMDIWWGLLSPFSLLTERRNILRDGQVLGRVCYRAHVISETYIHCRETRVDAGEILSESCSLQASAAGSRTPTMGTRTGISSPQAKAAGVGR